MALKEKCGRRARYKIGDGQKVSANLCLVHFSCPEIQHLITMKILDYEKLESGDEICRVMVQKREGPGDNARASKRVIFR